MLTIGDEKTTHPLMFFLDSSTEFFINF